VVRTLISTLESLVPLIVHTRGMDQCISHSRGQDRLSMTNMTHRWWAREGGLFFDLFRLGYGCAALKKMWEHSFVCVCVCETDTTIPGQKFEQRSAYIQFEEDCLLHYPPVWYD
jgi:hypothetical protein